MHVGAVVALRVADGFADERQRREMQDPVESFCQQLGDRAGIEQVGDDQPHLRGDGGSVPALEVVEHDDFVAGRQTADARRSNRCSPPLR